MKKTRKLLTLGLSLVMMLGLCLTVGNVNAAGDETVKQVSSFEEFKAAIENEKVETIEITNYFEITKDIDKQIIGKTIKDVRKTHEGKGPADNLININGAKVTFNAVTFVANENTRNLLSVNGGANVTLTGTTFDHSAAYAGAPLVVNTSSSVLIQEGFNMTLGEKSWYGVNVDKGGQADLESANITCTTATETQSVVCMEGVDSKVTGVSQYAEVKTADGQTAYVLDKDLPDFVTAKKEKDVTNITIRSEVKLNKTLTLNEDMTVTCEDGGEIVAKDFDKLDNVVTVTGGNVTLEDVKIVTDASTKSGLHIYGANVKANNLTIDNTQTKDGAAVVLNGGTLELSGDTTFKLGKLSWGGINIDNNSGVPPVMNVDNNATINVSSPNNTVGLYYVDTKKQNEINLDTVVTLPEDVKVTLNNKEVTVENGGITAPTQPDPTPNPDPEKPETEVITITMKAIIDGKEMSAADLGLETKDLQFDVEKGSALSEDDIKLLNEMRDEFNVEGYVFKGFFLDAKGTEALKANTPFDEDTTIYMIWDKEVQATVTPNPEETNKKPEQTQTTTTPTTESNKTVKTDDNSNTVLYGLMITISVVGAGIVVLAKKREELLNK